MAGVLGIELCCKADLLAHACHDSQVVEPFIHIHVRWGHQEESFAVDSTLPIFGKPVNQTAECGIHHLTSRVTLSLSTPQMNPERTQWQQADPYRYLPNDIFIGQLVDRYEAKLIWEGVRWHKSSTLLHITHALHCCDVQFAT